MTEQEVIEMSKKCISFHFNVIYETYDNMVKKLGEPNRGESGDGKTQCEWEFDINNVKFYIYDWKNYDRNIKNDGEVVKWHIGHNLLDGTMETINKWAEEHGLKIEKYKPF